MCTSVLAKEIKLIQGKCNVNLELLTLRRLDTRLVQDDQIIAVTVAVFQTLQIEATADGTILSVVTGLIGNDTGNIADLLATGIRKVQLIVASTAVDTNGFLLVEVQRENHVADLPGCRHKTEGDGFGIVLFTVTLIGLAGTTQILVIDDRHDHFLQADASVNEIQTATAHLDTYILSRSKRHKTGLLIHKLNRQQIIGVGPLLHEGIASTVLYILLIETGLINLVILSQRAIGVQEVVVSGDENSGAAELITNSSLLLFNHKVFVLQHR